MATFDRDVQSADDILGKADALLARHRGARTDRAPEPTGDFPILTEVVESAPATPLDVGSLSLDDLERELRAELLEQLSSELSKHIETRVNERVAGRLAEIVAQIRIDLAAEVTRALKETIAESMSQVVERMRTDARAADHTHHDNPQRPASSNTR